MRKPIREGMEELPDLDQVCHAEIDELIRALFDHITILTSPRKKENVVAALPRIPAEWLDQIVTGPMTTEAVEDVMRGFKKALIERALGVEMSIWATRRVRPSPKIAATTATAAAARPS